MSIAASPVSAHSATGGSWPAALQSGWESVGFQSESLSFSKPTARPTDASRKRLLENALAHLRLQSAQGATAASVRAAATCLELIVGDNSATPQVSADGEKGVTVEWLVDGRSIILDCDSDGSVLAWELDERGHVPFRSEFENPWSDGQAVIKDLRAAISALSLGVRHRRGQA